MSADPWLGDLVELPASTGGRPRKHKLGRRAGRQRKLLCESCGFIAQASAGAVKRCGVPTCACGAAMTLPNLRDRMAVDEESATAELESLSADAQRSAWRELGFDGMVERDRGLDRVSMPEARHRCEWQGGYCMKFTSTRYCPEHEHSALSSAYKGRDS